MKQSSSSGSSVESLESSTRALRLANDQLARRVGTLTDAEVKQLEVAEARQLAQPRTLEQARVWAKSANDRLETHLARKGLIV